MTLLRLHQVVQKNRGGIGRGIPIQPHSSVVVEHRLSGILGHH
jgi:hypothetical protein